EHEFYVSGSGYQPEGRFQLVRAASAEPSQTSNQAIDPKDYPYLQKLLQAGVRCNSARLVQSDDRQGAWQIIGDPTEGALLVAAKKGGINISRDDFRLISEIPFDSNRKAMSVIVSDADGNETIYTKGAPEVVLGMCSHETR